jgi:hypothetical protein
MQEISGSILGQKIMDYDWGGDFIVFLSLSS